MEWNSNFKSNFNNKEPSRNIFSTAIQGVRKNQPNSSKSKGNQDMNEDMIDFEMESDKLGQMQEKEDFQNKLRSAFTNKNYMDSTSTPFPLSNHKTVNMSEIRKNTKSKNLQVNIKNRNGNTITLKKSIQSQLSTPNGNDRWSHDLFNEVPVYKYSVFVRNMPRILTEKKFWEIFAEYGTVIGVTIERDTAEIYFNRKEHAELAAQRTNGREIFGKQIKVSSYETNEESVSNIVTRGGSRSGSKKKIDFDKVHIQKDDIWDRIKLKHEK